MSGEREAGDPELPRGAEQGSPRAAGRGPRRAAEEASGEQRLLRLRRDVGETGRAGRADRVQGRGLGVPGVCGWRGSRGADARSWARTGGADAGLRGGPQPTSLSGTHCGSSRPNGLPKARCSGTMRRPLGERTSFLASRRAATSEDMTPPQRSPAALTRTLAPPKAPPRQKPRLTREADSARAQSPSAVRSASQSAPGLRPIAVLANPRKGTAPATLWSVTNRQWGPARARSAPLGAIGTLDWPVHLRRRRCFLSDWRIRREAPTAHWKRRL